MGHYFHTWFNCIHYTFRSELWYDFVINKSTIVTACGIITHIMTFAFADISSAAHAYNKVLKVISTMSFLCRCGVDSTILIELERVFEIINFLRIIDY